MGPQVIFDIYDFVIKWAKGLELNKDVRQRIDFNQLGPEHINLDKLEIHHCSAKHELLADPLAGPSIPKSYVLFSSIFTNNTEREQTHSLRTERQSTATRRIQITKGLVKGCNLSFKLSAPNSLVSVNSTFKEDVTCQRTGESVTVEALLWSLNSEVVVPPHSKTRAELVVEENEYNGTFSTDIILEGKVAVIFRDKTTNEKVATIVANDIREVFLPEDGFQAISPKGVRFVMTGTFLYRLGIQQRVELHQTPLKIENGNQ